MVLQLPTNTLASHLRKKFNRRYRLNVGDLVSNGDGTIGSYQGISTHYNPRVIVLNLRKMYVIPNDAKVKVVGENFDGVPLEYRVADAPEAGNSRDSNSDKSDLPLSFSKIPFGKEFDVSSARTPEPTIRPGGESQYGYPSSSGIDTNFIPQSQAILLYH